MAQLSLLRNPTVGSALRRAWKDSKPGTTQGHEEGGFILRDMFGDLEIIRWPRGEQNRILMPPHSNCKIDDKDVIATFHTHPNTGADYLQEPSETDKRAVRDDPDLKGESYKGEVVLSKEKVYLIAPDGRVSEVEDAWKVLAET